MDWDRVLRLAVGALEGAANADEEFRAKVCAAARQLLTRLETRSQPAPPQVAPPPDAPSAAPFSTIESVVSEEARLVEATLLLGDARTGLRVRANQGEPSALSPLPTRGPEIVEPPARMTGSLSVDFPTTIRRCRLKARALRWQIERDRIFARNDPDEVAQVTVRDRALIDEGRAQPDCFLWMCRPDYHAIRVECEFEEVACCFDALAEGAELMDLVDRNSNRSEIMNEAMLLLGEAQSAIRVAIERAETGHPDPDQEALFCWLRRETADRRVYVPHLRIDEPAEPAEHRALHERIAAVRSRLQSHLDESAERRALMRKLRYHAGRLSNGGGDEQDCTKVISAIEALVSEHGVASSNSEIRDVMLPLVDELPSDLPTGTQEVVLAIDRYLDQLAESAESGDEHRRSESPSLVETRGLLTGRSVVIIGGHARERHRKNIESALQLSSLQWIGVAHHQSLEGEVRAAIIRPEVSVVITMTRWRSHQFGPQIRAWCRDHGKLFVELPGGYGVEQIAHQVLRQVGGDLGAHLPASEPLSL